MAESELASRFRQASYDAIKEIGQHMESDILKAFDSEFGYDDSGNKVPWPGLSTSYIHQRGSAHPILVVDGDLRAAVKVVVNKASIDTTVTSQKQKQRGGKGTISVADISADLSWNRPHTNPSSKWHPGSSEVDEVFSRHYDNLLSNAIADGIL